MMKKQIKLRLAIIAILVMLTIPAVMAYMYFKTNNIDNIFVPANVTCDVIEDYDGEVKSSIKVQNTGNIDAYIRLKVYTYWVNSKGNVVGRTPNPTLSFAYNENDWIQSGNMYYCKKPIQVNGLTPELLKTGSSIILDHIEEYVTNNGTTVKYEYKQVVEIVAEGIQSNPDEAAMESWNVVITDGKITSVN